jgi:hypothetical protein
MEGSEKMFIIPAKAGYGTRKDESGIFTVSWMPDQALPVRHDDG